MKYNELVDSILQEQYFGGSPYERASGTKKHITFEENITGDARLDAEQDFAEDQPVELGVGNQDDRDNAIATAAEVEQTLDSYIKTWQGSDKKKKSALDKALDVVHTLSERGQQFLWSLLANKTKYQEGGKIRSPNPEFTKLSGEWDEKDFANLFADAVLVHDPETDFDQGRWTYKYPGGPPNTSNWDNQVRGNVDSDGFMIEATISIKELLRRGYSQEQIRDLVESGKAPWGLDEPVLPGALDPGDGNPWESLNLFVAGVPVPIFTSGRGLRA